MNSSVFYKHSIINYNLHLFLTFHFYYLLFFFLPVNSGTDILHMPNLNNNRND